MATPKPIRGRDGSRQPTVAIDERVRALILKALRGLSMNEVVEGFYRGRYPDFERYASAVAETDGDAAARQLRSAVAQAAIFQPMLVGVPTVRQKQELISEAVLLHMPGPDFRLAVFQAIGRCAHPAHAAKRISAICKNAGLPWEFTLEEGFRPAGESPP